MTGSRRAARTRWLLGAALVVAVALVVTALALASRPPSSNSGADVPSPPVVASATASKRTTDETSRSPSTAGGGASTHESAPGPASTSGAAPSAGADVPASPTPEAREPSAEPPVERALVCDLDASTLEVLLGPDGEATGDGLRDAVEVLPSRLREWQDGAAGSPAAQARVSAAQDVLSGWEAALVAEDADDDEAARAARSTAEAALGRLRAASGTAVDGC